METRLEKLWAVAQSVSEEMMGGTNAEGVATLLAISTDEAKMFLDSIAEEIAAPVYSYGLEMFRHGLVLGVAVGRTP